MAAEPAGNASGTYGWLAAPPVWVAPPDLPGSALVFDATDGYVVLYETTPWAPGATGETWTFENSTWTNITGRAGSPPDMAYPGFAFDARDGRAILFGGLDSAGTAVGNWTWAFSRGAWTNLTNPHAGAPAPRYGPTVAYDPLDRYVLLFGGRNAFGGVLNDTWAFSGTNWTQIAPAFDRAPTPRDRAAMAYDSTGRQMVFYGGRDVNGTFQYDTWTYRNHTWNRVGGTAGVTPTLAYPAAISLAGSLSVLLVGCPSTYVTADSVWLFNSGNWTRGDSTGYPGFTRGCSVSIAPESGADSAVSLVPGTDRTCTGDTWSLNGSVWEPRAEPGPPIGCPSWSAVAIYDEADGYVVVFGGGYDSICCGSNSTWTFSNGTWTNITSREVSRPSPRVYASFAYDASDGYGVLFGGESGIGCQDLFGNRYCGETWTFHNGTWKNVTRSSAPHPNARAGADLAYDAHDGYVLLFGGSRGSDSDRSDTWSFHAGNWTNLTKNVSGSPAGRSYAAIAYDPALSCVLMYGGFRYLPFESQTDTWCYSNETWNDLAPPLSPPPTMEGTLTYDPQLGLAVLVGGWNFGSSTNDTPDGMWGFNGTDWAPFSTAPSAYSPLPSLEHAVVFDPSSGSLLLIGGSQSQQTFTSVWTLGRSIQQVLVSESVGTLEPGQAVRFDVATVGGSSFLSYLYLGLPPGCRSANLPNLTCSPTAGVGNTTVTVVVTDAASRLSRNASVMLDVEATPEIGTFVASPNVTDVGQPVTLGATTVGGFAPFRYSFLGLPDGCLAPNGPQVFCLPNSPGNYRVTVRATDRLGTVATSATNLVVNADPSISNLTLSPAVVDVGQNTTVTAQVVGGTLPYQYAYSAPLETCQAGTGEPVLNCSATATGGQLVAVTVTDAAGVRASASVFSEVNPLPQILGFLASPSTLYLGNSTDLLVSTTGGTPPLSINFTGLPTGCPGAEVALVICHPAASGSFLPSVTVRDATGATAVSSTPLRILATPTSTPHPASPHEAWVDGILTGAAVGAAAALLAAGILYSWRSRKRRSPPGSQ